MYLCGASSATQVRYPTIIRAFAQACAHLMGSHDFTSFSKLHTQTRTNDCTISKAKWEKIDNQLRFTITADRFLHNMVRAIVGTCVNVGKGKITPLDFKKIIEFFFKLSGVLISIIEKFLKILFLILRMIQIQPNGLITA